MKVNLRKSKARWGMGIKLRRGLWEVVRLLFWPNYFRLLSPVRVILLRAFGAKIHGPILIMDRVRVWLPWNLEVGEYSTIGSGCEIYNFGGVRIGRNSVVSQRTYICTASHDYTNPSMPLFWREIVIGDGVWIAAECFVAPGITIGDGAVVGARSVVTKNVSPWSVGAGNPYKFIKIREGQE